MTFDEFSESFFDPGPLIVKLDPMNLLHVVPGTASAGIKAARELFHWSSLSRDVVRQAGEKRNMNNSNLRAKTTTPSFKKVLLPSSLLQISLLLLALNLHQISAQKSQEEEAPLEPGKASQFNTNDVIN